MGLIFCLIPDEQFSDEPGVLYPLLAEKASYDPEHTKFVIFYLNPKARFSNGLPVTAEDVKFSFDAYQTKSNPGLQMYLADLEKLKFYLGIRSNLLSGQITTQRCH